MKGVKPASRPFEEDRQPITTVIAAGGRSPTAFQEEHLTAVWSDLLIGVGCDCPHVITGRASRVDDQLTTVGGPVGRFR